MQAAAFCLTNLFRRVTWRTGALLCALALPPLYAQAVEPGDTAPVLELSARQGPFDWHALKGQVVYLDFWASWCGPCRKSFPWMNEVQKKFSGSGFKVVGINLDKNSVDADKFLAKTPAEFMLAFDSQGISPRIYGVKGMPTSYLIGRNGKVLYRHSGFSEEGKAELEKAIKTALEEKS